MLLKADAPITGLWTSRTLAERDARLLTEKIVEEVFKQGAGVSDFGVHLNRGGFYFCAEINHKRVYVQTGQGNFTYARVAADLIAAAQVQVSSDTGVTTI